MDHTNSYNSSLETTSASVGAPRMKTKILVGELCARCLSSELALWEFIKILECYSRQATRERLPKKTLIAFERAEISGNNSDNISALFEGFSTVVVDHHSVLCCHVQSLYDFEKKGAYRVVSRNTGTPGNRSWNASGSAYRGSNPWGQPNQFNLHSSILENPQSYQSRTNLLVNALELPCSSGNAGLEWWRLRARP